MTNKTLGKRKKGEEKKKKNDKGKGGRTTSPQKTRPAKRNWTKFAEGRGPRTHHKKKRGRRRGFKKTHDLETPAP